MLYIKIRLYLGLLGRIFTKIKKVIIGVVRVVTDEEYEMSPALLIRSVS